MIFLSLTGGILVFVNVALINSLLVSWNDATSGTKSFATTSLAVNTKDVVTDLR